MHVRHPQIFTRYFTFRRTAAGRENRSALCARLSYETKPFPSFLIPLRKSDPSLNANCTLGLHSRQNFMNSYYHSRHSCAMEFNFRKHSSWKTPLSRRLLSAEAQGRLRRSCSPLPHSPLSQAVTAAKVGRGLTGEKRDTDSLLFALH